MRPPAILLPKHSPKMRGDVKPAANPKFEISAFADVAEITIFAEIGGPAGVTAAAINSALAGMGSKPVLVKINSYGGDAHEGVAIYNLLRAYPAPVTAQILGIAASAASIIAMAADRIEMARNSQMMIHQAWMVAVGNADLFREVAYYLDLLDAAIAQTYAAKTRMDVAKISDLMAAETYMDATDAIAMGFADELLEADREAMPLAAADATPNSKRDLESRLRQIGFSKSAAAKIVSGGWPALEGQGRNDTQIATFIEKIKAATNNLKGPNQ